MATVLTDARVLVNGADLSGQSNKVEMTAEVAELDATTFGDNGWKAVTGGLASHAWSLEGFWAAGDGSLPDDRLWADLGQRAAWTAAVAAADGSVAYLGNVMSGSHKVGGTVGELAGFAAAGVGSGSVVRGMLLHPSGTARTTSGTGTARQLGAVSSGKRVVAALHVCSVAGTTPSLTVKLRSSSTAGGTYADRVTFAAANALGSQLLSATGPITDTYWRVEWTISGGTPSFLFAVAAGITTL